ncbi:hypothetical protein BJX66DRAFT_120200 [Aspergillus keveii]|uniref:F-box domain-containing protein n=1 Tax=Aspergillus keveii TaxID=714993 RepID=A0ABR4FK46_9EURO
MADFNLFELPEELVAQVTHHLSAKDLASFVRTSRTSHRIGYGSLYSMTLAEFQKVINWTLLNNQAQTMIHLFRYNWRIAAKHPKITHGPLHYACKTGEAALVRVLLDTGLLKASQITDSHFRPWRQPPCMAILRLYVFSLRRVPQLGHTTFATISPSSVEVSRIALR